MVLSDAVRALLQEPVIVRMSVIDPNGYPHTVPVWFGMDGDDIMVITYRKTRKNEFIKTNPKGNISIGGDPAEKPGYLIKGTFALEDDADERWLREVTLHYEPKDMAEQHIAEWGQAGMAVLRFKVEKVTKT